MVVEPRRPIAFISGAGRGLGRAIAYEMAASGYDLVLNDLNDDENLAATIEGARAEGAQVKKVCADIADLGSHPRLVEDAFGCWGTIDCLVNNAGVQMKVRGDILDTSMEDYDRVLDVNLRGTFFLSIAIAKRMIAEDRHQDPTRRSIVSISSVAATLVMPEIGPYGISKAGISLMTKLLAHRLASDGIYVLEVRPGVIRTEMSGQIADAYDHIFEHTDLVPMKRWGEPEYIGRCVASLASGAIPFATGQHVSIDGGLTMHAFMPKAFLPKA